MGEMDGDTQRSLKGSLKEKLDAVLASEVSSISVSGISENSTEILVRRNDHEQSRIAHQSRHYQTVDCAARSATILLPSYQNPRTTERASPVHGPEGLVLREDSGEPDC